MKNNIKLSLITIAALAIAAMPLHAADKPEKAEAKPKKEAGAAAATNPNRTIPFRGKLAAKTDSSITVGARTFEVTSETKIMKDGKAATLADAVVGEAVAGAYRDQDGKLIAKSIRLGPKPEAAAGEAKPKKE